MAISIEQWRDQLPDSLYKFAKLKLEAGETDFDAGLLAAAVLWPIRQALRDGDDDAIQATGGSWVSIRWTWCGKRWLAGRMIRWRRPGACRLGRWMTPVLRVR